MSLMQVDREPISSFEAEGSTSMRVSRIATSDALHGVCDGSQRFDNALFRYEPDSEQACGKHGKGEEAAQEDLLEKIVFVGLGRNGYAGDSHFWVPAGLKTLFGKAGYIYLAHGIAVAFGASRLHLQGDRVAVVALVVHGSKRVVLT